MISEKDFRILEKYYDELHKMVINQAVSHITLEMKEDVQRIVKDNGRAVGICSKCNSGLLRMIEEAAKLYIENKDNFKNKEENANTQEQKTKRRRKLQGV